jgi:hypothetical protein
MIASSSEGLSDRLNRSRCPYVLDYPRFDEVGIRSRHLGVGRRTGENVRRVGEASQPGMKMGRVSQVNSESQSV